MSSEQPADCVPGARLDGATILVTRPAPQGAQLQQRLQQQGAQALWLPLLETQALNEGDNGFAQTKSYILDLDLYAKVICVSRPAARFGGALIDTYWPQPPLGIDWLAVGAGTAAELRQWDIEAVTASEGEDSEALLDLPVLQADQVAEQRILILRGAGGRALLGETLAARGARVDYAELYQRRPLSWPATAMQQLAHLDLVMLTSGEALQHFNQHYQGPRDVALIVPGLRLADMARALGWNNVWQSTGAGDDAMLECINRWRHDAIC
ncbi:uroporphyrinogen-III synthase [Pokkaliibacter plantistimulans]|uniref:Uroporphyrinogen-III synthase n=1 Tax=Proteobacteria bacterium 228 TaxID=2083153 RepID=A0A2S5KI82_9PROT|nr:uroporphyrinogen-III synthase [Pokkaliibacter plantistimulans]PPC74462.1 uroporphyrinogen-III synthase [Pokkaliibacter plantistimulans]